MPLLHLAILAIIQGITEFLPISSSGHLILLPLLTSWQDQGLLLDVAVHIGTLAAVLIYFRTETVQLIVGFFHAVLGKWYTKQGKLFLLLVVGTIPLVIAGFVLHKISVDLRQIEIIAWTTLGFGLLLGAIDRICMTVKRLEHLGWGQILFIGTMQIFALIPGTSRAGITITAARFLGCERTEAAKLSMLLSIPAILGAGTLVGLDFLKTPNFLKTDDLELAQSAAVAAGFAFIAALLTIWLFMAWLQRASMLPFVIYRILLGGSLLVFIYL